MQQPPQSPRPSLPSLHALALGLAVMLGTLAPIAAHAVDPKAAKYYEDALVRYEKKDLDGAIIQLKNALQIDKDMLPVQMLLGKALLQNGDVIGAEVALLEALRLGVNRAEVIIPLGQAYMAQGKHKLIFEQQQFNLLGLPPSVQVQLLCLRSAASADLGDMRNALKALDDARAIDPKASAIWIAEVPVRIRTRQFREAIDAAERAIALAPQAAEAWYQKGSVLHASGDLPGALSQYERTLTLDPNHVEGRVARAGLLIDLGRMAEAAKDLDELVRIAPEEPRAAYLRALLAERDNKPEVARAALKEVIGLLDPVPIDFIRYRPQLLMLNGLSHFGLNEKEKAKQYLEAFQKSQGNTPASKLLAQIYLGDNNVDRAIEVLEIYLKAQPTDGQAMTLLGTALMSKGQNARAAALMQQALQAKDAPQYRTVLGLSLLRSGQTGNAVTELESALKSDPGQTQAATSLIAIYLRSGQTAKAIPLAENLVKQQPGSAEFFNLLGLARAQSGNASAAKVAFEQSIKLRDTWVAPKLNLARLEVASKAYDAATARLNDILKIDAKNSEAMYELAALMERKGQLAEAQRWLEKANDGSGPKEVRWGLALSDFHLRHGRATQALEAAKRVSGKAPDDLAVLMTYARAQLGTGDNIGAKSTLTSATKVADYEPQSQLQIAMLQMRANNLSGAAYSLEKALSSQPEFLPALALMTEVELRQGDTAKAEKRAKDIIAKNANRAIGYSLLGDVAQARGQSAAALEAYRKAHQTEPSTETFARLFRALSRQDNGRPALVLAEQWLKIHPKDLVAQKLQADQHARNGNNALAKAAYEATLKMAPEDGEVLNNLANVLLRMKNPEAVKTAEQAVSKNPGNANYIDTLGWALYQNGQADRALQLLRDARLREPGNPEIRFHLATVLAKSGRKNEAREELESALKTGQGFESSAEASALLKSLK
jgi:putative PEP-CTERM system TPR-repeat lipoprotein